MAISIDINLFLYIVGTLASLFVLTTVFRSGLIFRLILSLFAMLDITLIFFYYLQVTGQNFDTNQFTLSILIVQLVGVIAISFLYKRGITDPLTAVRRHTDKIADGDLTDSLDITLRGVGEAGAMLKSIDVLSTRFTAIIRNIKRSSLSLGEAAEELASGSEEVAATTEEVTATIQTIAEGAAEQVRRLDEVSKILNEMVSVTEESIRQVGVTAKITLDLAEQTNFVSLNAAIEAAKASGESEGFQVVADHVRQLSVESKAASNSVTQITRAISARMRDSVDKIVGAVDKIASVAENTAASSQEAAAAAEEQSAALQEITQQAQRLADLSMKSEANIREFKIN